MQGSVSFMGFPFKKASTIIKEKRSPNCQCCGEVKDLQFAHVHRRKQHAIGQISRAKYEYQSYRLRALQTCVAGCYLLCAECHRRYDGSPLSAREPAGFGEVEIEGVKFEYPLWSGTTQTLLFNCEIII